MENKFDREFIADLAYFMKDYVKEIRDHLIDEAANIAADPMLCKLLHDYRARSEALDAEFVNDLRWCLNHGGEKPSGENVLLHPDSYHDVLADLLVKEWWSEECRKGDAA